MSALVNFCTFEVMDGATVVSVSSQNDLHPAEHAIAPLEPNFAWEAAGSSTEHTITIDLTESRSCDGFTFIHHETDTILITLDIQAEYSNNGTSWTSAPADALDYGPTHTLKLRYFATSISARYWRFTVSGVVAFEGSYISGSAPDDTRVSAIWLFHLHEFDKGPALPYDDAMRYPNATALLPFGKQFTTGYGNNRTAFFSRSWMLNSTERVALWEVIRNCNGVYRPLIFIDVDGTRRLCKLGSNLIQEIVVDIGVYQTTITLVELPIVKKDRYY